MSEMELREHFERNYAKVAAHLRDTLHTGTPARIFRGAK